MINKMNNKSKIYKLNNDEFADLVRSENTYSDVLRKLGLSTKGGSSRDIIKQRIASLNIDIKHFDTYNNNNGTSKKYKLEDILKENSTYYNLYSLKNRLVREKLLSYICEQCGNSGQWNCAELSLQLDHKNGINNDNRLENLRFLCPNCHSQTDNYAGKSTKRNNEQYIIICKECNQEFITNDKNRKYCSRECSNKQKKSKSMPIDRSTLKEQIRKNSFMQIGKLYNVSNTTIKKWCKKYELPYRKKDILNISNKEWGNI